ncbi:glycoside hydrolase family 31 protein [Mucor lusitanicus]|uniref:alpha-glucosidase n=2 Tax=Mucor circinelloides f. lusitanicus TaxID=29924 RepID=A0A168HKP5_MUCCL|nr:glycoside hydrolase family 31 protein [Mucor lusitanicus]OAC98900.1 glycoside hydrolase family 31 protein [Mucor lusitanicus CBS 277.49]
MIATTENAGGYSVVANLIKQTENGFEIPLSINRNESFYGQAIHDLIVKVDYETSERLHVKIYDTEQKQVQVPDSPLGLARPPAQSNGGNRRKKTTGNYKFTYTNDPQFGFQVSRQSDNAILFDTSRLPLIFEDQYLEISTHLPDTNIYGFGETIATYRRTHNVTTLWPRDAHDKYQNMYGAQSFYMDIRPNGTASGTFLLNAHGMDIVTTAERITYKAIGGVLDFYFFVPNDGQPNSVVQAYTTLVGKPMMPSLWMLGYQNCRYKYPDIDHVEQVVRLHKENSIPLETQWIDIDYMDAWRDFTFDPVHFPQDRMVQFSDHLHSNSQKLVVMVDPAIAVDDNYPPYTRGQELGVFIQSADGTEYKGLVWPGYTAFPDWWHPNITDYWHTLIIDWMQLLKLDGLWIDMNEPSSFCLGSCGSLGEPQPTVSPWMNNLTEQRRLHTLQENALNAMPTLEGETRNLLYPKYVINNGFGNISEKTVATNAKHYGNVSHYDLHNLYGHAEGYITREAIKKYNSSTRPFLLSRSTFAGSGQYMGHWTGDIMSSWDDLKTSVADVLNFQMYGISYSGADICGFVGNTTEELCTRWQSLGAFYPFARNHNGEGTIDQEPYLWASTAEATRRALAVRYALLPYLYTLFEESHRLGTGVWRPLIFEYPQYAADFAENDQQFLIGTDILVSPVLTQGERHVQAQFPPGLWYDWYDYTLINSTSTDATPLDAQLTHIPVHIRGGAVVATKAPKLLVTETYATAFHLLIALDQKQQAYGRLYIDDGHSLEPTLKSNVNFIFTNNTLVINGQFGYLDAESIGNIIILHGGRDDSSNMSWSKATVIRNNNSEKVFDATTYDTHVTFVTDGSLSLTQGYSIKFQ